MFTENTSKAKDEIVIVTDLHDEDSEIVEEQQEEVVPDKKIVTGERGPSTFVTPPSGYVDIHSYVLRAMDDPENEGALFYVSIGFNIDFKDDQFTYKGKTLDEWWADPAILAYHEPYEEWNETIYKPMDEEMTAAEERGEEHAYMWWKHDAAELYKDYWYSTHTDTEIKAYEIAKEKAREAEYAYDEWAYSDAYTKEYNAAYEEIALSEYKRLTNLGYDLDNMGMWLTGILTKKQIENFPALSEYGYSISWAEGNYPKTF